MRKARSFVVRTLMLAAVCLLGTSALVAPASAAEPSGQAKGEITWTAADGTENSARALSLKEVKAKKLAKYVDTDNYKMVAPRIVPPTQRSAPPAPEERADSQSAVTPLASTCWEHWFGHGVDKLIGRTDVTWCGDGGKKWVNYSAAYCWGDDSLITYKYLGCQVAEDYGHPKADEYWNIYDVWSQWDLCTVWVPAWGSCVTHDRPQHKYRYGAAGGIWQLS
ncbi:hypothetical protein [Streptomyces sp. NPDC045251]|uniref:hypothetical protein n=1 Tax=unclassified Streptomyces TaxID=2593676 RepID=UPI0033C65385